MSTKTSSCATDLVNAYQCPMSPQMLGFRVKERDQATETKQSYNPSTTMPYADWPGLPLTGGDTLPELQESL